MTSMVPVMASGMFALMPLWPVVSPPAGAPHLLDRAELMTLAMVTDLAIGMGAWMVGMGAWMAYRRHAWRDIAEMSAAIYLPFVIFSQPP